MNYIRVKEARQNLRSLISRVERGEQITITRQGKAVAQLAPPRKVLPPLAEFRRELGKAGTAATELLRAKRSTE